MKAWVKWAALTGVLLAVAVGQRCSSTQPGSDCVKCQCQCQGASGTITTTFERRDAQGNQQKLQCSLRDDCVEECTRAGAPTPVSATCAAVQ